MSKKKFLDEDDVKSITYSEIDEINNGEIDPDEQEDYGGDITDTEINDMLNE